MKLEAVSKMWQNSVEARPWHVVRWARPCSPFLSYVFEVLAFPDIRLAPSLVELFIEVLYCNNANMYTRTHKSLHS